MCTSSNAPLVRKRRQRNGCACVAAVSVTSSSTVAKTVATQTEPIPTNCAETQTDTMHAHTCETTVSPHLDAVATSVLDKCRQIDSDTRIVSNTRSHSGGSVVRIRTLEGHSVRTLASRVQVHMPLYDVDVVESYIDGAVELLVHVGTTREQHARARALVVSRPLMRAVYAYAMSCALVALVCWGLPMLPTPSQDL
jgi:hypothetical protein